MLYREKRVQFVLSSMKHYTIRRMGAEALLYGFLTSSLHESDCHLYAAAALTLGKDFLVHSTHDAGWASLEALEKRQDPCHCLGLISD
jgi:hypothetical protein